LGKIRGDSERGALPASFGWAHQRKIQGVEAGGVHRRADHSTAVPHDEGHPLGRHELRRGDQIPLVLPFLVVDDDHQAAGSEGGDGLFHGGPHVNT